MLIKSDNQKTLTMTVIGDVHDPPATGGGISPIMPSFPGGISPSGATSGNASPVAPDGYGQLIQVCIHYTYCF